MPFSVDLTVCNITLYVEDVFEHDLCVIIVHSCANSLQFMTILPKILIRYSFGVFTDQVCNANIGHEVTLLEPGALGQCVLI